MTDVYLRALDLFDEYIELPPHQRAERLQHLAQQDAPLYAALVQLLDADHDQPHASLLQASPADLIRSWQATASPAEQDADEHKDPRIGARLGAWRLVGVIAQGGMGTVYAAEREDGQYHHQVALKCIRLELSSPALIEGFRRERDVLAQMNHPGIADLIDGGVDGSGHPWFAMRRVHGATIDAWCDHRRLDVRARVDLLLQACDALAHAHALGVVHGDIKPSNLMVGDDGRVQWVDFGIATVREADHEHLGVTAQYAAPEQLRWGTTSVATDVHAFGVMMYRLLCGQWPFPRPALRKLLPAPSEDPSPMAALLANSPQEVASLRGLADVSALQHVLAGDLSAIARKAVASDPARRYSSIAALADDLRSWQERRPVSARPLGRARRAARFVARYRAQAALVALLAMAAGGALAMYLYEARQQRQETQARICVNRLFTDMLGTATLSGLSTTPFSSDALLSKTERELRQLPLDGSPSVFAHSLATLARSRALMGDYRNAQRLANEASRVLGEGDDPNGYIAATWLSLLNLHGEHAQAAARAQRDLITLQGRTDKESSQARIALGTELARAQWSQFQPQRAMISLDAALSEARELRDPEPIAELLILRANFYVRLLRRAQAEADIAEAIEAAAPVNPVLADDAREQQVRILQLRQASDAPEVARALLANRRRVLGERHPKTGQAWLRVGATDSSERGVLYLDKGLSLIESVYGKDHPEYAAAISSVMPLLRREPEEKVALLQQAVDVLTRTTGRYSERTLSARSMQAQLLTDLPGTDRRGPLMQRGITLLEGVINDKKRSGVPAALDQLKLAWALIGHGPDAQLGRAAELIRECQNDALAYFAPGDGYRLQVGVFSDKLLYRQGHRALADRSFAARISANADFIERATPKRSIKEHILASTLHESMIYRAFYAYETCDRHSATTLLRRAVRFSEGVFGVNGYNAIQARSVLVNLERQDRMELGDDQALIAPSALDAINARAKRCKRHSS